MKRSQIVWNDLRRYYTDLFPLIWPVLERFITVDGQYLLRQCELSPRWEGEQTVMGRSVTFKTGKDVIEYCQRTMPDTLQFGGILPDFDVETGSRIKRNREMCAEITSGYGPIMIDIDMNDFDRKGICLCLDKKVVCNTCFTLLGKCTRDVIHYWVEQVFGMSDIIDVYSGKRGLHLWICCDRAMNMTKVERKTFIERIAYPLMNEGITDDIYRKILLPIAKTYPAVFTELGKESLMKRLYPKVDVNVSTDACHLKKLPLMPHQHTRFISIILDPVRLFLPEEHSCHIGECTPGTYKLMSRPLEHFLNKMRQKKRAKLDE